MFSSISSQSACARQVQVYGYLGLLPFVIGLAGPLVFPFYSGFFDHGFIVYSYLIFAFLAGTLWLGVLMDADAGRRPVGITTRLAMSMAFSLLPFGAFFLGLVSFAGSVVLMAIGYLALWFWEGRSGARSSYPDWYVLLRFRLTMLVTIAHCVFLYQ